MEQPHLPEWFLKAEAVEEFAVEIWFVVSSAFYVGDENDPGQVGSNDPAINVPLPRISYAPVREGARGAFARLADVRSNPSELVDHFKACLALCRRYGKLPSTKKYHFWLRPAISSGGACLVGFPWYDTYGEFKRWAGTILTSQEQQVFWDADQGWELEVWQSESHFYFRRGSLEEPDGEADYYRFPKLVLREQIENLDHDCVTTFKRISAEIELDFLDIEDSLKRLDATTRQGGTRREATKVRPWWKPWR